jgi:hypothetical protein
MAIWKEGRKTVWQGSKEGKTMEERKKERKEGRNQRTKERRKGS